MNVVEPKIRGFICTTAHPAGCDSHVRAQINYIKAQAPLDVAPQRVLIIGASTGFGLASRIAAAFGGGAQTIGVSFERSANGNRTASAGWYNTAAFEKAAHEQGLYAKSINGDAFSDVVKQQVYDLIAADWDGQVDLVIYSVAAPRRTDPLTNTTYHSVLKPIGAPFADKTVNVLAGEVSTIEIPPASDEEVAHTIAVMGGDDWSRWIDGLVKNNLLANGVKTVAFTYIGPELTHAIYRNGTIGRAKEHLEHTALAIQDKLTGIEGQALISVNKALVTQSSAAIPVVPLYISLLYRVMKSKGIHEGCIEQMWRLFDAKLYGDDRAQDAHGRIRLDDWEMREDVQADVRALWQEITSENLATNADLQGYLDDFYRLFGFNSADVDYAQPVDLLVPIDSINE